MRLHLEVTVSMIATIFIFSCSSIPKDREENFFNIFSNNEKGVFPENKVLFQYFNEDTIHYDQQWSLLSKENSNYKLEIRYSKFAPDNNQSFWISLTENEELSDLPPVYRETYSIDRLREMLIDADFNYVDNLVFNEITYLDFRNRYWDVVFYKDGNKISMWIQSISKKFDKIEKIFERRK